MMGVDVSPALASLSTGEKHYCGRFHLGSGSLIFLAQNRGVLMGLEVDAVANAMSSISPGTRILHRQLTFLQTTDTSEVDNCIKHDISQ